MIASGFGILALVPAMLNISGPANGRMVDMLICAGPDRVLTVSIPVGKGRDAPGAGLCCAKACHGGSQRKRSDGKIEPAQ